MVLVVRAVYHNGQVQLLDTVDLPEGQQLRIQIETLNDDTNAFRTALGDTVAWSDETDDSDRWVEEQAKEIADALSQGPSLSNFIIEERNSCW